MILTSRIPLRRMSHKLLLNYVIKLCLNCQRCFFLCHRLVLEVVDVLIDRSCSRSSRDDSTLCPKKNDTDVTHYRFNPHQPISVIFGRDVAERVCY